MVRAFLTCGSGEVVSILGEAEGRDLARVAGEVGHVALLLQVPDLDVRVSCSRPHQQACSHKLLSSLLLFCTTMGSVSDPHSF